MTSDGAPVFDLHADASAVQDAVRRARTGLVDREVLTEVVALCAVAGEHLLVVGPPGTAKSEGGHAVRVDVDEGSRTIVTPDQGTGTTLLTSANGSGWSDPCTARALRRKRRIWTRPITHTMYCTDMAALNEFSV